ncbi:DUF1501 domain-containing protein [Planctomicrobium sp.]|jgi:hypothetical protein|nr:DUF1501 domain-containing protein [Planctomicrobium sp.]MDA7527995.1 DUF1501 domain-containing protein [bacterium]MDB4743553.1 DUF1501 domain-containing protein [Planctomicrobium sp.]
MSHSKFNSHRNHCGSTAHQLSRRSFMGTVGIGAAGTAANMGLVDTLTSPVLAGELKRQQKNVILLWLAGGASQLETWDPKPGARTGGPFASIQTSVPGVNFCELMPKMSQQLSQNTAIIRSLNTKIADHGGGYKLMETGRLPEPGVEFPHLGAMLAHELSQSDSKVPDHIEMYTSTEGRRKGTAGFLPSRFNPMFLTNSMIPENISRLETISDVDHQQRADLRELLAKQFQHGLYSSGVASHNSAFERVRGLMTSDHLFDIEKESQEARNMYGPTQFGEQCLIARRLVEAGVPFVKVARAWWDSHGQNFETHRELCADLDHVMSALLDDLDQRGLLENTLVITLGEFGRTPNINGSLGRDHFASAWSCSLSGCGIRSGTVYGKTDPEGQTVVDGEANAGNLFATIFSALGIDPEKEYMLGSRPIPLADFHCEPISEVLT